MTRWLALLALLAGCASLPGQPTGEHLRAQAPSDWIPGVRTETELLRMSEFTAPQTMEGRWVQKLTFERLLSNPVAAPDILLTNLEEELQKSCEGATTHRTYGGEENGYATGVTLLVCPETRFAETGQVTMVKTIQGNDALYTVTWAMRVPPFGGRTAEQVIDANEIARWSAYLGAVSVCDTNRAEHACVSPEDSP